jgi:hypothetical protein
VLLEIDGPVQVEQDGVERVEIEGGRHGGSVVARGEV